MVEPLSLSALRLLLDDLPLPAYVSDATGATIGVNRALTDLCGQDAGVLMGYGFADLIHPDDREQALDLWPQAWLEGQPTEHQLRLKSASGEYRWQCVQSRPKFEGSRLLYIVGTCHDIHALKRMETQTAASLDEERSRLARQRAVLDAAPHLMWTSRVGEARVQFNRTWAQYTGLDTWLDQQTWMSVIHPEDRAAVEAVRAEGLMSGRAYTRDVRFRRHDGQYCWHAVTVTPLAEGEWLGSATDIHERRETEAALQVSERRLRLALEGAQLGLWDADLVTGEEQWFGCQEALFGLAPGSFPGQTVDFYACVHEDDRERVRAEEAAALRGEAPFDTEFRIRWPSGEVRWLRGVGHLQPDPSGLPRRLLGINSDITDLVTARQAAREREAEFRALADSIPQLAWMTNPAGEIEWYNERWYAYTGTTFEAMRGWGWQAVHHPDHVERVTHKFRQALAAEQPWEDTFPIRSREGEYRWFLSRALPIHDATGRVVRWFGTNTDITERLNAEQEMRDLNASLEQRVQERTAALDARNRALSAFATLSRDLALERDPLKLVGHAQDLLVSLLPHSVSTYYEVVEGQQALQQEGQRWVLRSHRGQFRNPGLIPLLTRGVPRGGFPNLDRPFDTQQPFYQERYDLSTAGAVQAEVQEFGATATLPVVLNGVSQGVLALGLYEGRAWESQDRALLDTIAHALGLALERAQAVADVSNWKERYDVAVRGSGHLLYDWNLGSDAIVYGGALTEITGYGPDEIRGDLSDWTERLVHPGDRAAFGAALERVLGGEPEFHLAFRLVRQDGEVRFVEDDGAMLRQQDGVGRLVGFVKDVTERRATEEALRRSNERLKRANHDLEQFAYIASHDLQAPLRAVTSFAGLMERSAADKLSDRERSYLQHIIQSGTHMKRLVDDLLTFSRLGTSSMRQAVDSLGAASTALERVQWTQRVADAEVKLGDLPTVQADPGQLILLFEALLSNALKFTRPGVRPRVRVTAQAEGDHWLFGVSDNGLGIEARYHERIFLIFQRLHLPGTYDGTGAGLALAKKIVEGLGGRLWVDSTPGEGSVFLFTLPRG